MARSKTIYKEKPIIFAKYYHPQSDDFLEYKSTIQIKDYGKQPIILQLELDGMEPSFAPMPPYQHTIRAKTLSIFF